MSSQGSRMRRYAEREAKLGPEREVIFDAKNEDGVMSHFLSCKHWVPYVPPHPAGRAAKQVRRCSQCLEKKISDDSKDPGT
jgi:hypothetical protein